MNTRRVAVFLSVVLSIWAALHWFVFWRLSSVPWVASHLSRRTLIILAVILGSTYPLARVLDAWKLDVVALPLEWLGANWIGMIFLLFAALLAVDLFTVGGSIVPALAPDLRGGAVGLAALLAIIALIQGGRPPVLREYQVTLPGLPRERHGLTLVALSDLHLGTLLGRRWMAAQAARVKALNPDLVVIVGDLVDGNAARVRPLQPVLRQVRASLGVWAVTGNHEYYAGVERCLETFAAAGYGVLRNQWREVVPGLVLAGVDDLTAGQQFGVADRSLEKALASRPAGATVLLSHTPWQAEKAAAAGVGLMLSGHTHAGQVWPFNYLVRLRYPLIEGLYRVHGMTMIVGRGTGTWGPRMRLWRPAEILKIILRSPSA